MNRFVIGGGWSAGQYDLHHLHLYGRVYGINDAALWVDGVHTAVTMDRVWFEKRWPYLRTKRMRSVWAREGCDKNVPRTDKRDNWNIFTHWNRGDMSNAEGTLHGGNSGTCGVNRAYLDSHSGDKVFLLGFDMSKGPNGEPYWYPPYDWIPPKGATNPTRYSEWSAMFVEAYCDFQRAGVEIYNVSPISKISALPRLTFQQMTEKMDD